MARSRAALGAILAAALLVAGGRAPVAAESALWTLVASPLTAATGSLTTFSLVATNEDPLAAVLSSSEIGCVEVTLPANFEVRGAAVVSATTGASWSASRSANVVTVRTSSGGDRLALLDSVRFTITAMPISTGSITWQSHAHRDQSCGGSSALLSVPPVVVVSGPTVTSTPSPTPVPTPTPPPPPTPTPTAAPTASPLPTRPPGAGATPAPTPGPVETRAPTPTPVASPVSGPAPPNPSPRTDGGATPDPDASPAPSRTPRDPDAPNERGPGVINAGGPGGSPVARQLDPAVADESGGSQRAQISLGPLSLLGTLDVWIVPGLLYGIPGILLIAFVLLQAAGAAAWLPAIRRFGSGDG